VELFRYNDWGNKLHAIRTGRLSSSAGITWIVNQYAGRLFINRKRNEAIMNTDIQLCFVSWEKQANRHERYCGFMGYKITGMAVFFERGYYAFTRGVRNKLIKKDIIK
jgi:hypothetical protein